MITTIKATGPLDPNITTVTNMPIVAGTDKPKRIKGLQNFRNLSEYMLVRTNRWVATNATKNPVNARLKVRKAL